jgi:hypothetical protein
MSIYDYIRSILTPKNINEIVEFVHEIKESHPKWRPGCRNISIGQRIYNHMTARWFISSPSFTFKNMEGFYPDCSCDYSEILKRMPFSLSTCVIIQVLMAKIHLHGIDIKSHYLFNPLNKLYEKAPVDNVIQYMQLCYNYIAEVRKLKPVEITWQYMKYLNYQSILEFIPKLHLHKPPVFDRTSAKIGEDYMRELCISNYAYCRTRKMFYDIINGNIIKHDIVINDSPVMVWLIRSLVGFANSSIVKNRNTSGLFFNTSNHRTIYRMQGKPFNLPEYVFESKVVILDSREAKQSILNGSWRICKRPYNISGHGMYYWKIFIYVLSNNHFVNLRNIEYIWGANLRSFNESPILIRYNQMGRDCVISHQLLSSIYQWAKEYEPCQPTDKDSVVMDYEKLIQCYTDIQVI